MFQILLESESIDLMRYQN